MLSLELAAISLLNHQLRAALMIGAIFGDA
jgi:hypothetical protein